MQDTITCPMCATVLGVPKGGVPADGLECNWCGHRCRPREAGAAPVAKKSPPPEPDDPPAAAKTKPKAAASAKPKPAAPKPAPPTAEDDDDGTPYSLPEEEVKTRPCVECGKTIDLLAVICIHCGDDSRTERKTKREYAPIDRKWEAGWPFKSRMMVFLGCQALNLVSLIVGLSAGGVGATIGTIVFYVFLQAFLLGTYNAVRVRRNRKGQAEVFVLWRFCFVPLAPKKIDWKAHEGVTIGCTNSPSIFDWWIAFILLPMCLVPSILWWWYVIRSDRYFAALTRDNFFPETMLYRGLKEKQAKEIAQTVSDATALPLASPL